MSDGYKAYMESEARKYEEERQRKLATKKDVVRRKYNSIKEIFNNSKFDVIKCCRTCENFSDYGRGHCSKMCIECYDLNVCKNWKLSSGIKMKNVEINKRTIEDWVIDE